MHTAVLRGAVMRPLPQGSRVLAAWSVPLTHSPAMVLHLFGITLAGIPNTCTLQTAVCRLNYRHEHTGLPFIHGYLLKKH